MSRFERPPFEPGLFKSPGSEATLRLLFDWWCDEGDGPEEADAVRQSDRLRFIESLGGKPTPISSRSALQVDPAPLLTDEAEQGFRRVYLLSKPEHVRVALTDHKNFSNIPYASLGGASFLLAMDPPKAGSSAVSWHGHQQAFIRAMLASHSAGGGAKLRELAKLAVEQAALGSLAHDEFDLAEFAEQAALRYMSLLFGYAFHDHGVLEEASRATYRALQYVAIGQHFVTEPGTLPAAQQALGRLIARTTQLVDEHFSLKRARRKYGWEPGQEWPHGVLPWSELGLGLAGEPVLRTLHNLDSPLSGRDRATVVATLLAGTLGNIQSAVCLLIRSVLRGKPDERKPLQNFSDEQLEEALALRMAKLPPVPVLPRRTLDKVIFDGVTIPANTDCLLLLEGPVGCPHSHQAAACPRVWGDVAGGAAIHACLGRELSMPLIAAVVRHTLRLKELKTALDPLTGKVMKLERLWGFGCTRYPLRFARDRMRAQHNLIVTMRVKPPISENAMRLRRLIASGLPRIEHALTGFGHVHFAWFEFSNDDTRLVLRTIYDGQFEAYLQHFALRAGDLFDHLFEYLEDAPRTPVAEHPEEFVEVLRRHNLAPLAGYLYSTYPRTRAEQIRKLEAT